MGSSPTFATPRCSGFRSSVLRHLINTERVSRSEDGWLVQKDLPEELPLTIEDLLRGQLKVLDGETANLLNESATCGPTFQFNVLEPSVEAKKEAAPAAADAYAKAEETAKPEEAEAAAPKIKRDPGLIIMDEPTGEEQGTTAVAAPDEPKVEEVEPPPPPPPPEEVKRAAFLQEIRKQRDLVFDPEAIETLLAESGAQISEASGEAPGVAFNLPGIAKSLATAAKVVKVYPPTYKQVQDAINNLVRLLDKALSSVDSVTISHRGAS